MFELYQNTHSFYILTFQITLKRKERVKEQFRHNSLSSRLFHFHADPSLFHALGENVKEFFFRVASLAFETNVLAELEKSGSRQIGDVVSEYPNHLSFLRKTVTFVTKFNSQLTICFRD